MKKKEFFDSYVTHIFSKEEMKPPHTAPPSQREDSGPLTEMSERFYRNADAFSAPNVEITRLSKSAILNGELAVSGDVDIQGKITGDVKCTGNIRICGNILGNVACNDATLSHCTVEGDVRANGNVYLSETSSIRGETAGQSIVVKGNVNGNIVSQKRTQICKGAVVAGDVSTNTLLFEEGAAICGKIVVSVKQNDQCDQDYFEDALEYGGMR